MSKVWRVGGLWHGECDGKTHASKSLRECLLFALGFGCDQAAELRFKTGKTARKGAE